MQSAVSGHDECRAERSARRLFETHHRDSLWDARKKDWERKAERHGRRKRSAIQPRRTTGERDSTLRGLRPTYSGQWYLRACDGAGWWCHPPQVKTWKGLDFSAVTATLFRHKKQKTCSQLVRIGWCTLSRQMQQMVSSSSSPADPDAFFSSFFASPASAPTPLAAAAAAGAGAAASAPEVAPDPLSSSLSDFTAAAVFKLTTGEEEEDACDVLERLTTSSSAPASTSSSSSIKPFQRTIKPMLDFKKGRSMKKKRRRRETVAYRPCPDGGFSCLPFEAQTRRPPIEAKRFFQFFSFPSLSLRPDFK